MLVHNLGGGLILNFDPWPGRGYNNSRPTGAVNPIS